MLVPFSALASNTDDPDSFAIIQITDTQFLSKSYPSLFNELAKWIVNYSLANNLKMVVHTGDIVDNASDMRQWTNANHSMGLLLDAKIPYCWTAGNHDQYNSCIGEGNPNADWHGSEYLAFNATYRRMQDFWVDDCFDSKNTAVQFTFNGYSFRIINIEYQANDEVFLWMRELLNNSLDSNIIIATHSYLNSTAGYGLSNFGNSWELHLQKILDEYPNVFLTLNGHDTGSGANTTRVDNRQEVFFNRQFFNNSEGACSVRIYKFDISQMQVVAQTFSLIDKQFFIDNYNNFTFKISLNNFPSQTLVSSINAQPLPEFTQVFSSKQTETPEATAVPPMPTKQPISSPIQNIDKTKDTAPNGLLISVLQIFMAITILIISYRYRKILKGIMV